MNKRSTEARSRPSESTWRQTTPGLHAGRGRTDRDGGQADNTRHALEKMFAALPRPSWPWRRHPFPWISAALEGWGHTCWWPTRARSRRSARASKRATKTMRAVAKLARVDPELLCPIRHRAAKTQADQGLIKPATPWSRRAPN